MIKHHLTKSQKRTNRTRMKLAGVSQRPRLTVFRSQNHIYCQVIDNGHTVASANDLQFKKPGVTKVQSAEEVGKLLAEKALKSKVKQVVYDRGPYAYHGRVKALAEAARSAGLQF